MTTQLAQATEAAISHHVRAVSGATPGDEAALQEILSDYTEDALLFTPKGVFSGRGEIRGFYEAFLANMPPGMQEALRTDKQEVRGGDWLHAVERATVRPIWRQRRRGA